VTRAWRQTFLAMPGIGVAMLPKLLCPMCWPLYAGIVSSLGLGFLIGTVYLLPITSAFLILTVAVLGFRARQRRGFGPFLIGLVASGACGSSRGRIAWNAWPQNEYSRVSGCSA
jgi:mercuric ion transport protein